MAWSAASSDPALLALILSAGMPCSRANASASASRLFEMTIAGSAARSPRRTAATIARRLVPACDARKPRRSAPGISADDVVLGEELRDLDLRVLLAVGAVHRVAGEALHVEGPDRARRRVGRIGRPHHLAITGDGVVAFQDLHDDRARGHELDELAEERLVLVDLVELFRLGAAHLHAALADDAQAGLLDHRIDLAGQIAARRVRLDDREGAFGHGWASCLLKRCKL